MSRKQWTSWLDSAIQRLNVWAMWVSGIALVLMAAHVSFDAFFKYLFSLPIPATLEVVAYYYMPAVAALPFAYVEVKGGHIAVEMLYDRLPLVAKKVLQAFNSLVILGFIGVLTWLAGREALRKYDIGEYMFGEYPIIIWPGRFVFTAGLVLVVLVTLAKLMRLVVGSSEPLVALDTKQETQA